eukprot:7389052-Prymnesium_polylepis.1
MLRQRALLHLPAAAALRFGRLCAMLRSTPPLANIGGGILVWRLSADDLIRADTEPPGELVPWASLSPSMRAHQQRRLDALMGQAEAEARQPHLRLQGPGARAAALPDLGR